MLLLAAGRSKEVHRYGMPTSSVPEMLGRNGRVGGGAPRPQKGRETMGIKTKISWCDSTWNPVTGCFHECEYCYARRIAQRFGGASETHNNECCHECQWETEADGTVHVLDEPLYDPDMSRNAPYPFEFDPTFHRYRLDEPRRWKKPRSVFVCSMADLFGEWVPDTWIQEVFDICRKAPQHRYLFLTKNPKRFKEIRKNGIELPEKCWIGTSATVNADCTAWARTRTEPNRQARRNGRHG